VPGYDRAVRPGQNHSSIESPHIILEIMGKPWVSPALPSGQERVKQDAFTYDDRLEARGSTPAVGRVAPG
jgi:hypothetical protein